ncbi:MAG: SDR family NAD(P)-dependent oxidoreductase [Candidatus Aceula meridiana]|nr:SDR family NAD(P)-dependent oxidoreductase [Candidatus Aceula meridiana]
MENFKGTRVLVTGGAGCIGSFVVDQVLALGAQEVVVIDNFNRGSRENLEEASKTKRVTFVEGDIRDRETLDKLFKGIDYCFHLASLKIIQCAKEPRHAFEANAQGTYNVLECCAENKVKKMVFASTASIYGQADIFPTNEDHHPYNNYTLYGALKMCGELMCRSFCHMHGLKYNVLRYFNVFGPRMDAFGKYTEVLIRWYDLIKQEKSPLIFGDGKQTMDFIYVEDVARATVEALKSDVSGEVFNCASGKETSLSELCKLLLKVMSSSLEPQYMPIPESRQKIEVYRRLADMSKIKSQIGFEAKVEMKQGLLNLVQWLDERNK